MNSLCALKERREEEPAIRAELALSSGGSSSVDTSDNEVLQNIICFVMKDVARGIHDSYTSAVYTEMAGFSCWHGAKTEELE